MILFQDFTFDLLSWEKTDLALTVVAVNACSIFLLFFFFLLKN